MSNLVTEVTPPFGEIGVIRVSDWLTVTQDMISVFGENTLDPDPMHIDPDWARHNGPFGGAIAFGFLTISLLTKLFYSAQGLLHEQDSANDGLVLNYGFDRLRLVSPVPAGARVRGSFTLKSRKPDEKRRIVSTIACVVEIEGADRPALVADWLSIWVPPAA